jgi:hypothetical protein
MSGVLLARPAEPQFAARAGEMMPDHGYCAYAEAQNKNNAPKKEREE